MSLPATTGSPNIARYLPANAFGDRWLLNPVVFPNNPDDMTSTAAATQPLDRHAAAADIRSLGDLLEHSYGRYDQYAAAGLDVRAAAERQAQRIEHGTGPISATAAFEPMFVELRTAVQDQHFRAGIDNFSARLDENPQLIGREFRGPIDALEQAKRVSRVAPATGEVIPRLTNDGHLTPTASIAAFGNDAADALAKLGFQPVVDAPQSADDAIYRFDTRGDTGYIRIGTFYSRKSGDEVDTLLTKFVKEAPAHRGMKHIVFDLRGNGGGDDGYMLNWIEQMRSTSFSAPDFATQRTASAGQAHNAAWNLYSVVRHYMPDHAYLGELKRRFDASPQAATSTPSPAAEPEQFHGAASSSWDGDVTVLVDRNTASSGEGAANQLKAFMGAKIVGQRTAGYLEGSSLVDFTLPATGISISVPSLHNDFVDPRVQEGVGIPIDVAVDDITAPADQIAEELRETPIP